MKKVLLTAALLAASHASSQETWQTIHTEHFNVHFSTENQQWARSAATELDIVRDSKTVPLMKWAMYWFSTRLTPPMALLCL